MSSPEFAKVLLEVLALKPDERTELRSWLDAIPADGGALPPERKLDLLLLEKGVISRIPPPITDFTPYRDRKPIAIPGKPLSETIIEERR